MEFDQFFVSQKMWKNKPNLIFVGALVFSIFFRQKAITTIT